MFKNPVIYSTKRGLKVLSTAVFLTSLFVAISHSDETAPRNLVISTGDNFPPYTDLNLPHGGMTTLTVTRAFEIQGSNIQEIQWVPWKRSFETARNGENDGSFPWNYSDERAVDFIFSDAIREIPRYAWTAKRHHSAFASHDDLENKTVCRPLGYGMFGKTKDLLDKGLMKRMTPNTMEQCFRLLVNGRVDFVEAVESDAIAGMEKAEIQQDSIHKSSFATYKSSQHFIISKKNPRAKSVITTFNEGLKALKETGEFDEITAKFNYPSAN